MEASTLVDEKVIEDTAAIVAFVAHGPMDHPKIEVEEGGKKVTRCGLYPNLECADHKRGSEVVGRYIQGRFRLPSMIWVDGDGKELFRKPGYRRPAEFLTDMKNALAKLPGKRVEKA